MEIYQQASEITLHGHTIDLQLIVARSAPVCTFKLSSPPVCTFKEGSTDIDYKMISTFGMTCTFGMSSRIQRRMGSRMAKG